MALDDDVRQLREQGYSAEIAEGLLVVRDVPYVNSTPTITFGTLISLVEQSDGEASALTDHQVFLDGDPPCNAHGEKLPQMLYQEYSPQSVGNLDVRFHLSCKPKDASGQPTNYSNYFEKMLTYIRVLSAPVYEIDPNFILRKLRDSEQAEVCTVFEYGQSNSVLTELGKVMGKLEMPKVALVGLGGSGSYTLDFLAKTPIGEIHLFDGDTFLERNAFRCPGAAMKEEVDGHLHKVQYLCDQYSRMRKGIIPHAYHVTEGRLEELDVMDFVFVSIDCAKSKRPIVKHLQAKGIPFTDVGIALEFKEGAVSGTLRVTFSSKDKMDHFEKYVNLCTVDNEALYRENIQIAELNAFTAMLAVIKWKKFVGFYADDCREYLSTYVVEDNCLTNAEVKQ